MRELAALFGRETALVFAQGGHVASGLVFFLCLIVTVTFGLGPDLPTLERVAPAILWTGPVLSVLLGIPQMLQPDAEDGTLDAYRAAATPLELVLLGKAAAYWVWTALPLVIAAPLFGVMLNMEPPAMLGCVICLAAGSPALVLIGAFGGALTVAVKRSGMLVTVLATPFLVPVVIFGVSASTAFTDPATSFQAPFLLLIACNLFFAVIAAFAGAAAIRASSGS